MAQRTGRHLFRTKAPLSSLNETGQTKQPSAASTQDCVRLARVFSSSVSLKESRLEWAVG